MDLGLALAAFQQRVSKELARMRGLAVPSTELAGGWSRVGARLDDLLRVAFHSLCLNVGRGPDAEFRRLSANVTWSLSVATAGQLVNVLPRLAREVGTGDDVLGAIIAASTDPRSAIWRAIAMRNAMIHDRVPPVTADLHALLEELAEWSAQVVARLRP